MSRAEGSGFPDDVIGTAAAALPLTPATYDLRRSVGYLMVCSSKLAKGLAEDAFAHEADLGFMQFMSLMLLGEGVATTPGDLAGLLGYTSGAVTRHIDRMERAGLIERVRSDRDRRSIAINVTSAGRHAAKALLPHHLALWNMVLGDFDPTEFATLIRLLEKLLGALRDVAGPASKAVGPPRRDLERVA